MNEHSVQSKATNDGQFLIRCNREGLARKRMSEPRTIQVYVHADFEVVGSRRDWSGGLCFSRLQVCHSARDQSDIECIVEETLRISSAVSGYNLSLNLRHESMGEDT